MELKYYHSENGIKIDDCDGRCAFCPYHFKCSNVLKSTKSKSISTQVTINEAK